MDKFKTYEEAQEAWDQIKQEIIDEDEWDDPEGEDEDDINRLVDEEFISRFGFDLVDF